MFKLVEEKETLTVDFITEGNRTFKAIGFENDSYIQFLKVNKDDSIKVFNDIAYFDGKMEMKYGFGETMYVDRENNVILQINGGKIKLSSSKLKKYRYIYVGLSQEKSNKYIVIFTNKVRLYRM